MKLSALSVIGRTLKGLATPAATGLVLSVGGLASITVGAFLWETAAGFVAAGLSALVLEAQVRSE